MFMTPQLVFGTEANSAVRVGLLGCGGRGTEDATNLIDAGAHVVALADLFQDQLDAARTHFNQVQQTKGYAALDSSQLFVGPKAYEQIAASNNVDAIVIATPPYYHPQHLEAVVAAGKHVYLEKPIAVDVAGAHKVIEIGKRAQGKLSLDVGFQIRDCPPFVELVNRIHNGALGNMVCGEAYYLTGYLERPSRPNASPVELSPARGEEERRPADRLREHAGERPDPDPADRRERAQQRELGRAEALVAQAHQERDERRRAHAAR